MRTKKILSVLLAVIMTMGVFCMTGAFADNEEAISLQATTGWGTGNNTVTLKRGDDTTSGEICIYWESFLKSAETKTDSYFEQKNASLTECTWKVYWAEDKAAVNGVGGHTKDTEIHQVYSNKTAATGKPFNFYSVPAPTKSPAREEIYLSKGTSELLGKIYVTLEIKANDTTTTAPVIGNGTTKGSMTIAFLDLTELNKELKKADDILAKSNRYKEDYIKVLRPLVANAKSDRDAATDQDTITALIGLVKAQVDVAKDNMQITDIEWLDFLNGMTGFWYGMLDFFDEVAAIFDPVVKFFTDVGAFFSEIGRVFKPVTDFFTQVFNAFGFLGDLLKGFLGWFGL